MNRDHPLWAEVNLAAVARNVRALKSLTGPGTEFMAVVKAGGYGHGMVEVARTALDSGASWLGVARAEEGITLRKQGIQVPVLVFGLAEGTRLREALENNLTLTVFDRESARRVSQEACFLDIQAPVHVKVDTGMGRLGFPWGEEAVNCIPEISRLPGLNCSGIYTHFARADDSDKSYTWKQLQRFQEVLEALSAKEIHFNLRHAANSAALLDLPETHLDMVRPGLALYGLYPGEAGEAGLLQPAMCLKTRVAQVKEVGAGFRVSYGSTYITPAPTVLATLAVGYADGYTRLLSSRGQVLVRGKRAPVVGRVCMDQCVVDVGHVPGVAPGDEVVLMGGQGGEYISAEEIAAAIGTINYEVVTSVSSRVPRIYV